MQYSIRPDCQSKYLVADLYQVIFNIFIIIHPSIQVHPCGVGIQMSPASPDWQCACVTLIMLVVILSKEHVREKAGRGWGFFHLKAAYPFAVNGH